MAERNKSKSAQNSRASVPPGKLAGLTELEKRFVDHYLQTLNATQSYLAVRPLVKRSTAEANGHRLLRKAEVAEYLEERRIAMLGNTEARLQRVVQELERIAFFDPRKLFDDKGQPLPIHQLDADAAAAIVGIEAVNAESGSDGRLQVLRYKYADKSHSLDKLMKHLGGYQAPQKTDDHGFVARLKRARERSKASRGSSSG